MTPSANRKSMQYYTGNLDGRITPLQAQVGLVNDFRQQPLFNVNGKPNLNFNYLF